MTEQWRAVPEDDRYEVSNLGNARSFAVRGNAGLRAATPKMLARTKSSEGYPVVSLGRGNQRKLHRLVLEAFVGPCPPGQLACHNNGDRSDSRLVNLRWDTPEGNCADEVLHGTSNRGERNNTAKLTEADVYSIRSSQESNVALAIRYGVSGSSISRVRRRRDWAHVA